MKKYDLVIIGAGSGGLSAAAGAAKLGLKVLLVEKNRLGGDCLWNGCIPSKTLLHEAEKMLILKQEMNPDGGVNIDFNKYYEKAKLRIKQVENEIAKSDSVERFESLGVDVVLGEAKFYSKKKIEVVASDEKKYFKFKKCIIASGSHPKIPEMFNPIRFVTNEQFFDLPSLPKTLTVVGGGSIGVEMATAMAMFGTKVRMILKEEFVMAKEEEVTRKFMAEKLKSLGIEMYPNANIRKVFELDGEKCVELESGVILKSEVVLVAVGREFNSNLDLQNASIELNENKSIRVNDQLQTTNKRVYAIGDCNGKMLFTHAAGYQAKAVLNNLFVPKFLKIFGLYKKFIKGAVPTAFPWVTYTSPEVAHVGKYSVDLDRENTNYKTYTTKLEHVDRAKAGGKEDEGFIQVLVRRNRWWKRGGKILGVTIVAPHAGELITEWVLAIENNLPVEAIFNTVHAYPTLSELNPRGTFEYMSEKLTPFKSKLLKLFFKM
jgi:pyruvate/2-oxoglutarate dehydrogenase complex dihydrolipoamide dehydrogenase (E3) component